jgi:GNAT superfamily N-acetyltransferase
MVREVGVQLGVAGLVAVVLSVVVREDGVQAMVATDWRVMTDETKILPLAPGDEHLLVASTELFDDPPSEAFAKKFLSSEGHHLLVAVEGSEQLLGFISGVETTHPDKGTEMFLYELSVDEAHRNRGIGTALVRALEALARERGCYGMWVVTEPDNVAALATYRAAGAALPEPSVALEWSFDDQPSSSGP